MSYKLVTYPSRKTYNYLGAARQAKADFNLSYRRQLQDIFLYSFLRKQYSFSEYYVILPPELRADARLSIADFVGGSGSFSLINKHFRDRTDTLTKEILHNKLIAMLVMEANHLPQPRNQAVFHPCMGGMGAPMLRDAQQIATFLRTSAAYPLFGKTIDGEGGIGAASIGGRDSASDSLEMIDGSRVPVAAFAEAVARDCADGYLFQDRVVQHPEVTALCGDTVGAVRIVTLRDGDSVRLCYASWKLPPMGAVSDNSWRGSISASVDLETGRITRAQIGAGFTGRVVDVHPVSGAPLIGRRAPLWPDMCDAALRAAAVFPQAPLIGWDIAFGVAGPVILEGNTRPSHLGYQISTGRGALDTDFARVAQRMATENAREASAARSAGRRALLKRPLQRIGSILSRFASKGLISR